MLFVALSVLVFFFSLLNVTYPLHRLHWKLSVLSTEYGHYFSVLPLALLAWNFYSGVQYAWLLFQALSFLLLVRPMCLAWRRENFWRTKVLPGLLKNVSPQLLSLKILFFGRCLKKIPFQRSTYFSDHQSTLVLDFYPPVKAKGAAPWVLVVHGGGWDSGDSQQLPELNWHLAQRGVGVVSMTYRLAPQFTWPTPRDDVREAIRFVKEKSAEWGLDPQNYYLLGRSAGGQLAGAVAYTQNDPGLKGLIAFYAPTDMIFGFEVGEENDIIASRGLLRAFMGSNPLEEVEKYREASLTDLVEKYPVPTLLLHGDLDRLSWFKHSERLAMRLAQRRVPYAFVRLPWATHGFDFNLNGPGGQISSSVIEAFVTNRALNSGPNV